MRNLKCEMLIAKLVLPSAQQMFDIQTNTYKICAVNWALFRYRQTAKGGDRVL